MNKERGSADVFALVFIVATVMVLMYGTERMAEREMTTKYRNKCFTQAHLELEYLFCKSLFNDKDSK